MYKVFDLKNYALLYTLRADGITEIKISPGIMLLIFQRTASHVPLKILNIEDGAIALLGQSMCPRRELGFSLPACGDAGPRALGLGLTAARVIRTEDPAMTNDATRCLALQGRC